MIKNGMIKINFFPLQNQVFDFKIYRMQVPTGSEINLKSFDFSVRKYKLPRDQQMEYLSYFTAFIQRDGFNLYISKSTDNNDLTIHYLFTKLEEICKENNIEYIQKIKYEKRIDVVINKSSYGKGVVSIIPSFKGTKFGFIMDYHFSLNDGVKFDKQVQILSLSLNEEGRQNSDYYRNKYDKIFEFVNSYWDKLFEPFSIELNNSISKNMMDFSQKRLEPKKYIFGNNQTAITQFKGISDYGPYSLYSGNPILCFVFREYEKPISHELYYALKGKKYPTFSGLEKMFKFSMSKDNVIGIGVKDYSETEIENLVQQIKQRANDRIVLTIVLVPWTRDTASEADSKKYYFMKHYFLKNGIPSQFVGINRVTNYETFKWSVGSVGLQLFTKLGGSPWKLDAKTKSCLIIGIGQAHKFDANHFIEKYFSYSIISDSTGLFKNIKILSDNENHEKYLNGLMEKLKNIIMLEINNYDHFVIHTSFRLRKDELAVINNVIDDLQMDNKNKHFAVMRFNDNHRYMGYSNSSDTLTPYESTYVRLSKREFLVWFEGLSSKTNTIKNNTRIGPPMLINIDYPEEFEDEQIMAYLQDAINLSGANWRGFNAKTTPISILYAHLLSEFVLAFEKNNLETINIENLNPWFL
jgi:hypothetical protein